MWKEIDDIISLEDILLIIIEKIDILYKIINLLVIF